MRALRLSPVVAIVLLLAGCSAGPSAEPPTESAAPVDHTVQATVDGEWILTRTVTTTDDANNAAHAVGTTSTRNLLIGDVSCTDGPCTGGVLSGASTDVRESALFRSSGNVLTYKFTGYLHCLRQDTGKVLVANGFSYTSTVELHVATNDAADESIAATLEGTMTYTDTLTNEAIAAGCTREPIASTTEYTLTAVRAAATPAA